MRSPSRRGFLEGLFAGIPIWAARRLGGGGAAAAAANSRRATLSAIAEVVLPGELGDEGRQVVVSGFESWMDGLEPEAELDHSYLSSDEIRYGPSDPRPRWEGQLGALEATADEKFSRAFSRLTASQRIDLLRDALLQELPGELATELQERLPYPGDADHVALAMVAWFFGSSQANDLCYGAEIGRHTCRGLPGVEAEPQAQRSRGHQVSGRETGRSK